MKKIIASLAVIIYFTFATGVIVNIHYCMGHYDSFQLYKSASDWCNKCGMHAKKHGCCHDEVKIAKLQDDHQTSSASFELKSIQPEIIIIPDFFADEVNNDQQVDYLNHSPPLLKGREIYLQNCVFRI